MTVHSRRVGGAHEVESLDDIGKVGRERGDDAKGMSISSGLVILVAFKCTRRRR